MKVHLPGNPKGVWKFFSPPNNALQGACNNYVKLLALAVQYGSNDFKREMRFQAKKAKHRIKLEKYKLYVKSHEFIRSQNEKEVNSKVKTSDKRWKSVISSRDASWNEMMIFKYISWRILSIIVCYLPAAIPLFIPPAK